MKWEHCRMFIAGTIALFACTGDREATMHGNADGRYGIPSEISCDSCTIVLDTVAILQGVDALPGTFAQSKHGGAIYLVDRTDYRVKWFDGGGRLLGTLGRRGGGPGEYEQVSSLIIAGDRNVHVLDGVLGRHSVFAPSGELLSTTRVMVAPGLVTPAVLQTNGRLVVNRANETGSKGTVDLIDTSGNVIVSAEPIASGAETSPWLRARVLWLRASDEVLIGKRFSPTITTYTPDLMPKDSITRAIEWFPALAPGGEPGDGVFDKPVTARLNAIWEDAKGRLWLYILAASPDWKPKARPDDFKPGDYLAFGARPRAQAIVEVIDIELGRVLARARFEGGLGEAFGDGLVADYLQTDPAGEPEVRILRLTLED